MHNAPPVIPFQQAIFFLWRRAVGRFLFTSNSVREQILQLGPLGDNDAVIYIGVIAKSVALPRSKTVRFCEMFAWPENSVIFGITGQLIPDKGQTDFIEAAKLACRSYPPMRFVIGGRGSIEYTDQLKQLIAARGLEDYVGLCGWLPHVTDFYEGIDVFVLASRYQEAFGLVLTEAGERGVPAIATASGGPAEALVDGKTGILVERQNPRAMAQAMVRLGTNAALRQWMGQRAREHVVQEFDLKRHAQRLAELLFDATRLT